MHHGVKGVSASRHAVRPGSLSEPKPLSEVRYAGPEDLEDLLRFLDVMRDEIDGGRVDDSDLLADTAHDLVNRLRGVVIIAPGPVGVEGSLGLVAERPRFSRTHYLRAVWFVVGRIYRSSGHAKSLLLKAREFSDQVGRPLLIEECNLDMVSPKIILLARHVRPSGTLFRHIPGSNGGMEQSEIKTLLGSIRRHKTWADRKGK